MVTSTLLSIVAGAAGSAMNHTAGHISGDVHTQWASVLCSEMVSNFVLRCFVERTMMLRDGHGACLSCIFYTLCC